ncbi:hypothetical protein LTR86_008590 [Recurvomyces mirabilis]|nr:hypothetical protein LTR86_008590 [Recurvomyces mirabilis]
MNNDAQSNDLDDHMLTQHNQDNFQVAQAVSVAENEVKGGHHHTSDLNTHTPSDLPLTFPTLCPDGSVEDISTLAATIAYTTPPAALSSLGARASMAQQDTMSESTSSFADSQYDMVDDLSEISNDDGDTASLASTDEESNGRGVNTPEEQDGELEDTTEDTISGSTVVLPSSSGTLPAHDQDNELLDSYMTGDLETPTQSTVTDFRSNPQTAHSKLHLSRSATRVLFVSSRDVPEAEKTQICAKVTSALAGSKDASKCRATILPLTPTGIAPSPFISYHDGGVTIEVMHCVGAKAVDQTLPNGNKPYKLQILDADGEHSSIYIFNDGLKPKLGMPQLTVIYDAPSASGSEWLTTAEEAIKSMKLPTLVVRDSPTSAALAHWSMYTDELLDADNQVLRTDLKCLINRDPVFKPSFATDHPERSTSARKTRGSSTWSSVFRSVPWKSVLFSIGTVLVSLLLPLLFARLLHADEVADANIRREALSSRLPSLVDGAETAKLINASYLVPQPAVTGYDWAGCKRYTLQDNIRFEVLQPNHIIVSLPPIQDRPGKKQFHVVGDRTGAQVKVNATELVRNVYDLAIPIDDAHGAITFSGVLPRGGQLFIEHNFGNRMLQRQTYQKARTDLSNSVNKELTVARDTAKVIREKLGLEVGAGAAATRNITKEVAVQMTRDLQIFANAAASAISKMDKVINSTATIMIKDLALIKKDLVRFTDGIRKTLALAKNSAADTLPTKKTVTEPLKLSRKRALSFKEKLLRRKAKKVGGAASKGKEHAVRVKDWMTSLVSKKSMKSLSVVPEKGMSSQGKVPERPKRTRDGIDGAKEAELVRKLRDRTQAKKQGEQVSSKKMVDVIVQLREQARHQAQQG